MQHSSSVEPAPVLPTRAARAWVSLALLAATLVMTVPIYGGWLRGVSIGSSGSA